MKLTFITREGFDLPGARIRCYNFARALAKYGIDTEILSFADTLGAKDGAEESQLRLRAKIRYNWQGLVRLVKDKDTFFYIQRFNYHSFAPLFAHLINNNRMILDLDDWEMCKNPKYYLGFYPTSKAHYFTKLIARKSIFCIAASRFLQRFLSQFNKAVYYIPSGTDTELFRPTLQNAGNHKIVFSWIGTFHRLEYVENIKFALHCFNKLSRKYAHIYFDIVGDGIYSNAIARAVNALNNSNIFLKPWIPPEKMNDYLAGIDIGLFPVAKETKFNQAKSPTKLFEYMAMSKPTVSSRYEETENIIQDGENGLLAETKDKFTEKMEDLVKDIDLRRRLGKTARKTVEQNYSLNALGERLYKILDKINV